MKQTQLRTDVLIPPSVLEGSEEQARSARILLTGTASAVSIALLFTLIHVSIGDMNRALFSLVATLPLASPLALLWLTKRVTPGVHLMLGLCTGMVILSPTVAGEGEPAFVALMIVPVGAALMSGARAGMIWSVLITLLLVAYALEFPFSELDRKLAWISAVMAAGGGFAATLIERARDRAREDAEAAALVRDRTEAELTESRALFETVFRRSNSLLCLMSFEEGRLLDVNEAFSRVSGWSRDEVLGKTLEDLNAWVGVEDLKRIFDEIQTRGRIESAELRMRTKSGDLVWLRGSIEVLQQQGRNRLLTDLVDITEAKQASQVLERYRSELEERYAERGEQLEESREQLRQRDRLAAIGTLAAGVAHQINNPIGGIVAATEYAALADDDEDRERIRSEALETAREEAKRCGRIVKNVLKFARDEPTVKWVGDLSGIVRSATELARTHVITHGGTLRANLESDPLLVLASSIDLEQVVLNLVHNASESKPDGADVVVETIAHQDYAELAVSDNGYGIDPRNRPHIFEPFYTSRVDKGGTGLGLSVVHGIVGDHGGKLQVEAVPAGGTRVRVLLPRVNDEVATSA